MAIRHNAENELETFNLAHPERIFSESQAKQDADERLLNDYDKALSEIECAFADKIELASATIENIKSEQNDCDKELLKLKYLNPFIEEKDNLTKQLNELSIKEKELTGVVASKTAEINSLQAEYDKLESETRTNYQRQIDEKQAQSDSLEKQISEINEMLDRTKGSLFEWLEENKKDWENNIGKVINEGNVLYQTGLHPQKSDGNSFFGVRIDLDDLPLNVRKPKQLQEEKEELESKRETIKKELLKLFAESNKAIENLKHQFSPKMKELRGQKSLAVINLDNIPQQQKAIRVQFDDFEAKGKTILEQRQSELNNRRQELAHRMTIAQKDVDKLNTEKQKQKTEAQKKFDEAKKNNEKNYTERVTEIHAETKLKEKGVKEELQKLKQQEEDELKGRGADTHLVEACKTKILSAESELKYIENHRKLVYDYRRDCEELFDQEDNLKNKKKALSDKLLQLNEKYDLRKQKHEQQIDIIEKDFNQRRDEKRCIEEELERVEKFTADEHLCPPMYADVKEKKTLLTSGKIVDELTSSIVSQQSEQNKFKQSVNVFKGNFSAKNTFNFNIELNLDEDYLDFANNLDDFINDNKIEEYRRRTSERYLDILARGSKEMGELTRHESDVDKIIQDINNDFRERNFVGVIKLIALRSVPSTDKMVQLLKRIKEFHDDNQFAMGDEMNIFATTDREEINQKAVGHLLDFMKSLTNNPQRQFLTLSELFQLQYRIIENANDTGWADKLSHVGSEGTDTLVKAMINIMLINVFKEKVSRKFGDFCIHCMMDEIGKLHPQNVKGILDFANARNILLINSSPTTYNVTDYRYTYLLEKDSKSKTVIHQLISQQ